MPQDSKTAHKVKDDCTREVIKPTTVDKSLPSLPKKRPFLQRVISVFGIVISVSTIIIFTILVAVQCLRFIHDVYITRIYKDLEFPDERLEVEGTYYNRECDGDDITASSLSDFTIDESKHTTEDAKNLFMLHGGVIIPQIMTPNTTRALRDYIEKQNHIRTSDDDQYYVHAGDHRISLKLGVNDHPIIGTALKEIATNPIFRPLIESLTGLHPAVCEITSITAAYGAAPQWWHADVATNGSPVLYGNSIRSTYTMFMPLQHTTREMGATGLCPGSNMCPFAPDTIESFCDEAELFGEMDGGWAYLMDQTTWHRGGAHVDKNGEDRVMFVVSFTSSQKKGDTLTLPTGLTYSLRWDMWGHTVEDMETVHERPWNMFNSLGIFKRGHWGWSYSMINLMLAASGGIEVTNHPDLRAEFDNTLNIVDFYSSNAYMAAVFGCFLFAYFCESKEYIKKTKKHLFKTHSVVLLTAAMIMFRFCRSEWAQTAYNRKMFTNPSYPTIPETLPEKYYQSLPVPQHTDILFSDRLDNYHLHAKRHFLDFHPGNIKYHELNNIARPIYLSLNPEFKTNFISMLIDTHRGRWFLRQNDWGDWLKMSTADAFEENRRALLRKSNASLIVISDKIDFIINQAKYGYWHKIGRRFVPGIMYELRDRIFMENGVKPITHKFLNIPQWTPDDKKSHQTFVDNFAFHSMTPLIYVSSLNNVKLRKPSLM